MWVRNPAGLERYSRSKPITAPATIEPTTGQRMCGSSQFMPRKQGP